MKPPPSQAQQDRFASSAPDAAEQLTALVLAPAKILMEVQDLHPLAMAGCLPQALTLSKRVEGGGEVELVRC